MRLIKQVYQSWTDESLMQAIAKGEQRAFDELYHRYSSPMLGYFMRLLWRDKLKAEDFLHDLFAKIIQKPEYFDPSRSFKTWIYSVANNMCKNEYKKQEVRKGTVNGLDNYFSLHDETANVLNEVEDTLFQARFQQQLNELDEKHREVFSLRHLTGLSLKEIAEILQIQEGTVKSRLFYATKNLAESLKEYNPIAR